MSSANFVIFALIGFVGPVLADDRSISDSSIAALSIVFGFILLVVVLSACCYCVRKNKQLSRSRRVEKLEEIKKVFEEHFSEHTLSVDGMVTNDKPIKFSDWQRANSASTVNSTPVIATQAPSRQSRYFVRNNRGTRSISPTRASPREPTYERGRSRQRFVYPSKTEYDTLMMKRSKSAPSHNRKEYVPNFPNRNLVYTKSHYLAIKQPFGKKYLLPPMLTHYAERPASRRVLVQRPPPQVVVPPPQMMAPPPPPKREVYKPKVYHVQYQPSQNQHVQRSEFPASIDEDFRLQTTNTQTYQNSYQNVRSYEEPVHTTYRTYDEPIQTTLTNYKPRIIRPEPYVYTQGGDTKTTAWSGETFHVNTQIVSAPEGESAFQRTSTYTLNYNDEARVANGTELTKTVADDYTIVDYVEDGEKSNTRIISLDDAGPSGEQGTVTVISTSSPAAPAHNSSALNDLDNMLGDNVSSSSSSSSSSSRSSKKS